jgi:septum formation topological specificity factor MinE
MPELIKAKDPFKFCTRLHLSELTGLRATTLGQLLALIKEVPGSCIYHHTHRFLQQHQFLSPEPPNDFAYWVTGILGEDELGERLVSIDTIKYSTIRDLREEIVSTIEKYLENNPLVKLKFARSGEEFHFIKSVSFILPTTYIAYDLNEFAEVLKKITIDSIYFHIFEARLRLEKPTNDFAFWIENSLGDKKLANEISSFDPYTSTLEDLRNKIIQIVERKIED